MTVRLDYCNPGFSIAFRNLINCKREAPVDVSEVVARIVSDVKTRGDIAVCELTAKFDRFHLTPESLAFQNHEISGARTDCSSETLAALELAAERITAFHEKQMPNDLDEFDNIGIRLGYRWTAIDSAGLYVPGGTAAYPSSVLMNAIPAKVAGVKRLVMVVPTPDGNLNPLVLAAAEIAGVNEVYRVGGAQAIAALAYGTQTINAVDKITGPGNAYVSAAKKQVFGIVGIDMIAGPSEILVVADSHNDPAWISADLLSQAEHDPSAQAVIITDDPGFASSIQPCIDAHLKTLPRAKIARASWRNFGAIITVPSLSDAIPLVNDFAPEHLQIAIENPRDFALKIRNAGAIFLGRFTPEAIGDYIAGPNHVLPTSRSAKFSSGLSVLDFMKRTSMLECDSTGLKTLGPMAKILAQAEGLDAHALSIAIRLNYPHIL